MLKKLIQKKQWNKFFKVLVFARSVNKQPDDCKMVTKDEV